MIEYRIGEILYYSGNLDRSKDIFLSFQSPIEYRLGSLLFLGMIAVKKGNLGEANGILNEIKTLY
ncbi:MAG: hypothetical protein U9R60_16510, partial [Bacteroidota bacterium]|nr:hypothetical protein [Bacteroidota bacterium]